MRQSIQKNAVFLTLFALACTLVVATTAYLTRDKINQQAERQLLKTLSYIIDPKLHNNNIYQDCILVSDPLLGSTNNQPVYLAKQNEHPIAAALTVTAPDGYNGNITLLVAIAIDGTISGVRTLKHQETPGLGDKIETRKSDWILSFTGKKLIGAKDNRWAVSKDGGMFDQFTGATITPRAVVKAIAKSLHYFQIHQEQLFNSASNCYAKNNDEYDEASVQKVNESIDKNIIENSALKNVLNTGENSPKNAPASIDEDTEQNIRKNEIKETTIDNEVSS